MPRQPRDLEPNYCSHVTVRCNNREFKLIRHECHELFLYSLKQAIDKFNFKIYALCIMSNHVHYLIEPKQPEDLSRIMHWLNWYTAMCFNRMLNRTGHFWEKRYHSSGFENTDYQRAKKQAPGQMKLPWAEWEATSSEIREVAEKFVIANCYNPQIAAQFFNDS